MYEHSCHMDFGAAAGEYVDALMDNIDWTKVYGRHQAVVVQSSEAFGASADEVGGATRLDVRRAGRLEQADALIQGARWRDPEDVGSWSAELPRGRDVVGYCVYGHEVGRATAMRLRAAGADARFLRGGFDGWKAAGRPLQPKRGQR